MYVRVRVKVLGVPAIPAQEREIEFEGGTVAALRDRIGQEWDEITTMDGLLLAFINGRGSRASWDEEEGDRVLFALPVGGG
jgi:hypothetical protein